MFLALYDPGQHTRFTEELPPRRRVQTVMNMLPDDRHFVLSSLPPNPAEKRLALAVVLVLGICFFITAGPLSSVQLARIDAFIPAYASAMFVNDLITAVLFMGMGLPICRSIIEAHHGQIWVAANASRGAMFQFVLGPDAAGSRDTTR